jgi:hypothetical protein
MYGSTNTWSFRTQGEPQYTTVIYLDDDPLATTKALLPCRGTLGMGSGALFAGPLRQ